MNEKYANYDYTTTTVPFKNDLGMVLGKETKTTFKLCTKDCKYKQALLDIKNQLDYLETYCSKEDEFDDMKRRLTRIEMVVNKVLKSVIDKDDVLGSFLLVNDYRVLSNEELEDVKISIKSILQENKELKANWNTFKQFAEFINKHTYDEFITILSKYKEIKESDK